MIAQINRINVVKPCIMMAIKKKQTVPIVNTLTTALQASSLFCIVMSQLEPVTDDL